MDEGLMWLYFCIAAGSIMLAMLFFAGIGCFCAIMKIVETIVDIVDDIRECLWHSLFWRERQEEYGDNWGDELRRDLF